MYIPEFLEELAFDLSDRQRKILMAMRYAVDRRHHALTVREIGEAVGLSSPGSVSYQLRELEQMGLVYRQPHGPRSNELRWWPARGGLVPAGDRAEVRIPMLGTIAAGIPIAAQEDIVDHLELPAELVGRGAFFALIVKGESMIEWPIHPGDVVIVRQQDDARHGDLVAAMIEEEATVKKLRKETGVRQLVPCNSDPRYQPFDASEAIILGKVFEVRHRL